MKTLPETVEDVARMFDVSIEAAHQIWAAVDIMCDDGCPADTAAALAVAAYRTKRDPEDAARHFVRLRHAAKAGS